MLRLTPELKWEEVWKAPEFGMHWNTPVVVDGNLYAFHGRNEPDAWLKSYNIKTGQENWKEDFEWAIKLPDGRDYRNEIFSGKSAARRRKILLPGRVGFTGDFGYGFRRS